MALSDDKIKEIRVVDKDKLRQICNDAEAIKGQALEKVEKEYRDIVEKVQALMDKKGDLLRSPMSKAELLDHARDELKKRREEALSLLRTHLEDCQKGHSTPFYPLAMKGIFAEDKAHRLPWLILTDKDIENLVDGLPEIGIPATERDAKVAAIDEQIAELTERLKSGQRRRVMREAC